MRKSKPKKRYVLPDPKFRDELVTKFVNYLMVDGKKSVAYGIFYDAIELVENRTKEDGLETWKKALNNVMPSVEVKSRRVGGATFQVPLEVRPNRRPMPCSPVMTPPRSTTFCISFLIPALAFRASAFEPRLYIMWT